MPPTHWRLEDYFDADPKAPDRTYARRGGFLAPVDFPPLEFGIAPNNLEATDTTQLLGLLVARQALEDAGYGDGGRDLRPRPRQRDPRRHRHARAGHPAGRPARPPDLAARPEGRRRRRRHRRATSSAASPTPTSAGRRTRSPACSATSPPAGSPTASTSAAPTASSTPPAPARSAPSTSPCSSSPPAAATWPLTGGLDTFNDIFMYMCFSKTPALSPTGDARPFDAAGDGTILGEGLGMLVLKRLDDARRDGDRIYAVIRAVGTSSDGKGQRGLRAERGGAGEGAAAGVRAGGGLAGDGRAGRGARHRHEGRRRDRAGGPDRGLPRGEAGGDLVRPGVGQVADRPHQGGGGGGGADQGGAGACTTRSCRRRSRSRRPLDGGRAGSVAVLRQHRGPALAAPAPATPGARRSARSASAAATSTACSRRPSPRCPASTGTATSRSSPSRPTRATGLLRGARRLARTPGLGGAPGRGGPVARPVRPGGGVPAAAGRRSRAVRPGAACGRRPARSSASGPKPAPRRRDLPRDRPGVGGLAMLFPGQGSQYVGMLRDAGLPVPDDARGAGRGRCRGSGRRPDGSAT